MKYIVTADEMQRADHNTSQKIGIPSVVLMERAAMSVAEELTKRFSADRMSKEVCIVCGTGNNGGDGFALGRILNERGFSVHFFMVGDMEKASEANRLQRSILKALGLTIGTGQPALEYDMVVDAIFGTGLHREITGSCADWIDTLNQMKGFKVALDIPSGISSDSGEILGCAFEADLTVTFGFCKWGQLLYPGKACCGELVCADIGIPVKAFLEKMPFGQMAEREDIAQLLPERILQSHKGTYGKAGIVAGSKEMGGAVVMCSRAAFKMGCGYVKVLTHMDNRGIVLSQLPEALLYPYEDEMTAALRQLEKVLTDASAIAVGPGIGMSPGAEQILEAVLKNGTASLVLDADAINLLSKKQRLRELLKVYAASALEAGKSVIMTPHKKEFSGFAQIAMNAPGQEWHETALKTAAEYGIILVLKDAVTRVYAPDGSVYVNTTGNPGMSVAGSGDVLTGMLAGLLAQMKDGVMAAVLAVYLHGACGDLAAQKKNCYTMTATDIMEAADDALKTDALKGDAKPTCKR